VRKKWSIKISQIAPAVKEDKQEAAISKPKSPVNQPKAPAEDFSKAEELMRTPGYVLNLGEGDTPVFSRPLTGPEFASIMPHMFTQEDVFNSIVSSLSRQGFDGNANYSHEQIKAFQNKLDSDLISEYGQILKYLNGDYLK